VQLDRFANEPLHLFEAATHSNAGREIGNVRPEAFLALTLYGIGRAQIRAQIFGKW